MEKNDRLAKPEPGQRALVTYAVLAGMTPLIPVPFADDMAKNYFRRRLVRALGEARGVQLSREQAEELARDSDGCLGGCLIGTLLLPLKLIFRKVFFFLEWKRAVDLTSYTYHYGYLIDYALASGRLADGSRAGAIRMAAEQACKEAPIRPVETAIRATYRQSRDTLKAAADLMGRALRRSGGRPNEERISAAVGEVEEEERRAVTGLIDRLQQALAAIPESHFARLRARFDEQMDKT